MYKPTSQPSLTSQASITFEPSELPTMSRVVIKKDRSDNNNNDLDDNTSRVIIVAIVSAAALCCIIVIVIAVIILFYIVSKKKRYVNINDNISSIGADKVEMKTITDENEDEDDQLITVNNNNAVLAQEITTKHSNLSKLMER